MHLWLSNNWTSGCGLNAAVSEDTTTISIPNMFRVAFRNMEFPQRDTCLPGRDLSPPLTMEMSSFLLVRSLSSSSVSMSLPKIRSRMSVCLPSSHTHSSQHWPATLTNRGFAQPRLGRESSCGHSGTHPTAPSMHVHWCLQLGWKLSPFW